MEKYYQSSNLNEILDGSITPLQKSREFIQSIGSVGSGVSGSGGGSGGSGMVEGRISVEQFIDYYLSLSLVFEGKYIHMLFYFLSIKSFFCFLLLVLFCLFVYYFCFF